MENWIPKENVVKDCKTVEVFANKYRKPDRFTGRGKEYADCIIQSHYEELEQHGYCMISRHESLTGKAVYWQP